MIPSANIRRISRANPVSFVVPVEEVLFDVERQPGWCLQDVLCRGEGGGGDVTEAESGDEQQAIEPVCGELCALGVIEIGEVHDDVLVVHARPVPFGGHGRLRDDVDPNDVIDTQVGELVAHHAVAGADVQDPQRGRFRTVPPEFGCEEFADNAWGRALEPLLEQMLVQARDLVDLVVVVEPDPFRPPVDLDVEELLVLIEFGTSLGQVQRPRVGHRNSRVFRRERARQTPMFR